jgi:hypothetical protein
MRPLYFSKRAERHSLSSSIQPQVHYLLLMPIIDSHLTCLRVFTTWCDNFTLPLNGLETTRHRTHSCQPLHALKVEEMDVGIRLPGIGPRLVCWRRSGHWLAPLQRNSWNPLAVACSAPGRLASFPPSLFAIWRFQNIHCLVEQNLFIIR